jgi:general secretion pathway protein E
MRLAAEESADHRLTLPEVLTALVEDGHLPEADIANLMADRRLQRPEFHPLVIAADQKWHSAKDPSKILTLDFLTEWLAGRVGMEYFHIDPLKINVSAVTEVVSNAYAMRFKILPVGISKKEAIIATAEPYIREYEKELTQMLRLDIRRVIANPGDIARYVSEFYNLARSIKKAGAGKSQISISSISSTGSGSMRLNSAPVTSTSSRAGISASCASASTACCIRFTRFRWW